MSERDIVTEERLRRAEKALTDELVATNPLWKPWAMDLADDVNSLVAERDEAQRLLLSSAPELAGVLARAEKAESERDEALVALHETQGKWITAEAEVKRFTDRHYTEIVEGLRERVAFLLAELQHERVDAKAAEVELARLREALGEIEHIFVEADYPALHTNEAVKIARAALVETEGGRPQ